MSIQFGQIEGAAREVAIRDLGFAAVLEALRRLSEDGAPVNPEIASKLWGWSPTRPTPAGYKACTAKAVYFSKAHQTTVAEYVREILNPETGFVEVTTYTFTWKDGEYLELEAPQHSRHR